MCILFEQLGIDRSAPKIQSVFYQAEHAIENWNGANVIDYT